MFKGSGPIKGITFFKAAGTVGKLEQTSCRIKYCIGQSPIKGAINLFK